MLSLFLPGLRLESQAIKAQHNTGGCFPIHTDSDFGVDGRCITAIAYLNPGWQPWQGGELRLYPWPSEAVDIAPLDDRLVLFSSKTMLHRCSWGLASGRSGVREFVALELTLSACHPELGGQQGLSLGCKLHRHNVCTHFWHPLQGLAITGSRPLLLHHLAVRGAEPGPTPDPTAARGGDERGGMEAPRPPIAEEARGAVVAEG